MKQAGGPISDPLSDVMKTV